jgi:hypothetical protein
MSYPQFFAYFINCYLQLFRFLLFSCHLFGEQLITDKNLKINVNSDEVSLLKAV